MIAAGARSAKVGNHGDDLVSVAVFAVRRPVLLVGERLPASHKPDTAWMAGTDAHFYTVIGMALKLFLWQLSALTGLQSA